MSATNRGTKRRERDAYQTPPEAIDPLIREIAWGSDPQILEPCIGDGHISSLLILRGVTQRVEWCEISKGRDFLTHDFGGKRFDYAVSNPPFSYSKEFVDRALEVANCVIMLLPQSFFGAVCRRDWWRKHPPTAQFILSHRPSFTNDGRTDSEVYSWVVWDAVGRQKRGWYWI